MSKYSLDQRCQMAKLFYQNNQCAATTVMKFNTLNNIKRKSDRPDRKTVLRVVQKFSETNSLANKSHGGHNSKITQNEVIDSVKNKVQEIQVTGDWVRIRRISNDEDILISKSSERYVHLLEHSVIPQLKSKRIFSRTYFMQDGAAPHMAHLTRDFLRKSFGERIIGRFFDISWPSHSPDLNPCDWFLWGFLKDSLFKPGKTYQDVNELQVAITDCLTAISKDTLSSVFDCFLRRVQKWKEYNCCHFE